MLHNKKVWAPSVHFAAHVTVGRELNRSTVKTSVDVSV